jgi:hypothetical protein
VEQLRLLRRYKRDEFRRSGCGLQAIPLQEAFGSVVHVLSSEAAFSPVKQA